MAQKPTQRKSAGSARTPVAKITKPASKAKPTPKKALAIKAGKASPPKKPAATKSKPKVDAGEKEAKKLEALDAAEPKVAKPAVATKSRAATARATAPQRNSDFPNTFIKQINVSLDDPDHTMTLDWSGPQAASQETGPFRTAPGAGRSGLNCDITATSRRSGTYCTPKGTFTVSGFQGALNSDSRATFVTWFVRARGIALHYFPSVPKYAASHGCVRIEQKRIAQLVQSNSRAGVTKVVVGGTWTKPARQF